MHTEYVCYPVTIIMHLRNVYSLHGGALGGYIIRFFRYHILHIRVSPHIQDSTYVCSSAQLFQLFLLCTYYIFKTIIILSKSTSYVHTLLLILLLFLLFSSLFFFLLARQKREGWLQRKIGPWWRCIILKSHKAERDGKR